MVFENFKTLSKDPKIYPAFTSDVAADAQEQTLRTIVDHLLNRDGDYRELFTTRKTFVSGPLAALYKLPVSDPKGWEAYEFSAESEQAGLLTQFSFVAMHSHPGRSSATRRGKGLREVFLCQSVPIPPPNVDFSIVEDPKNHFKTARERVDAHLGTPGCAGCHKITDPIGLSLEVFDGAGALRRVENNVPIDPSGELDGVKFKGPAGLGATLAKSPVVSNCLVRRLASYGFGQSLGAKQKDLMMAYKEEFADEGYRLRPLLREIVTSAPFYNVPSRAPTTAEPIRTAFNQ
jgi:Protein of unknown function (DUF1588)/Protein of unknown function (DUF1585)/Protein of unknown function (DUF1592)